jgi:hypothetical protein
MHPRNADFPRRSLRWAAAGTLVALTPKCLLCFAGYVGLGAAFGPGGPELCGGMPVAAVHWTWLLPALGAAGCLALTSRCAAPNFDQGRKLPSRHLSLAKQPGSERGR